jgi:hypothetical protein
MNTLRAATLWLPLCLAACASSPPAEPEGDGAGPALILATDAYELQVQGGRVLVFEEGVAREVQRYEELRELYTRDGAALLPERPDARGTNVLGWRDLECVRRGQTCGREPDFPARDMLRLKLRFD